MKRLKKGFTLIELLVVIAIIGILATTLAPKLREQLAKAKDAKAVALLGAARTAASVVLVDKMVQDTTGSALTIILTEIEAKLDAKTAEMVGDSALVAIGAARPGAAGAIAYGSNVTLVATSGTAISTLYTVTGDDLQLKLQNITTPANTHSTEGKEWTSY